MATEIEHKYLVKNDEYKQLACESHHVVQGYLSREKGRTVRVRLWDDKAFITIKGPSHNAARLEFEYEIPVADAKQLLTLCPPPVIDKTRYIVMHDGNRWEIDEFHAQLAGLTVAELEIPQVDYKYSLPSFVGEDVTRDPRYFNSNLTTFEALSR